MKIGCFALVEPFTPMERQFAAIREMGIEYADLTDNHNGGMLGVEYGFSASVSLDSHPQAALARRQMSGGSSIVAFEVTGGKERAFRLLNALELVDIANNLGDAKSLITHPATTTHQRIPAPERAELGITEGLLRISVGLEDVEDVKEDLAQALEA